MSKCKKCQENLSLYIDDYLSDEETKEIEEHLNECPECQKELIELQEVAHLFKTLRHDDIYPPIEMRKQIREKLEKQTPRSPLLGNIMKMPWKVLVPLTSAALIMIFIFYSSSIGPIFTNQAKPQASHEYVDEENKAQGSKQEKQIASNEDLEENEKPDDKNKASPLDFFKDKFKSFQNSFSKEIAVNDKDETSNTKDKPVKKQKKSEALEAIDSEEKKDEKTTPQAPDKPQSVALHENNTTQNSDFVPKFRSRVFDENPSKSSYFKLEIPEQDLTQKIENVVDELDGEIIKQSTYLYDQNKELEASKITLSIAESNYDKAFNRLKQLGHVETKSKATEDKQEEANKIKAEIETLRAKEKELAKSEAHEELSKVKQQIKKQENNLKDINSADSIVTVDIEVKEKNINNK